MQARSRDYRARARQILSDAPEVRDAVTRATRTFDAHRSGAFEQIDAERWRAWAEAVKSHLLMHLDDYLVEAEARLQENGAVVHWAERSADVHEILGRIVEDEKVERVVKGKSMLSEELGVNDFLESRNVHVSETDLGEYVIQLLGEPPSHIVGPAIHRSVDDIRRLFHERLGTSLDAAPDTLASAARDALRADFLAADMGITGGNFLVAETGTLALIENEGNIRLSTSAPRIHLALVGIEKLLPRLSDLAGFLQLTSRAATGQPVGNFVSLIHGPRRGDEVDGPEQVHVVLVDNGRTELLADEHAWEALRCVRCGACLNICPVFRQTGGHAYGWAYSGPIGSVLAPGLLGLEESDPLPFASSLCGACSEVCPVRIPIHELLLTWRERMVGNGSAGPFEKTAMRAFRALSARPELFARGGRALGVVPDGLARRLPVLGAWSEVRAPLRPSPKTFRALWREGIE